MVVVGDRKMAVFDDTLPWPEKLLVYPHRINWQGNIPVPLKADAVKFDIPEHEPLKRECEHFLECIFDNKEPLTSGREGIRVVRVLNACQQSLNNNGKRIQLPVRNFGITPSIPAKSETYYVHSSAFIEERVSVGKGTNIWCFSHILSDSTIGEQCNIGQNVMIGPEVTVGNRCKIQNNVSIYKGVTLEDGVFCGPSMVFTNVYNPRAEISKMDQVRNTLVKKGTTIGANSTIICGVTLGKYSFIGAGAVITRDVLDYALMTGNPARQVGWVCECGERLSGKLNCTECGNRFKMVKTGIERF